MSTQNEDNLPSATQIVASKNPKVPAPAPAKAEPVKGVVKDEKTLDFEISEAEDKLFRLRQLKGKPKTTAPATANKINFLPTVLDEE